MKDAPTIVYADRGPNGGWIYRESPVPDTQYKYIRTDGVAATKQFNDESLWKMRDRFIEAFFEVSQCNGIEVEAVEAGICAIFNQEGD